MPTYYSIIGFCVYTYSVCNTGSCHRRRCMVLLDIMNRSNVSWHHDEAQSLTPWAAGGVSSLSGPDQAKAKSFVSG